MKEYEMPCPLCTTGPEDFGEKCWLCHGTKVYRYTQEDMDSFRKEIKRSDQQCMNIANIVRAR